MGERKQYFAWVQASKNTTEFSDLNADTGKELYWENPFYRAEVKNVNLWFPSGVGGWLMVRILKNGVVIAPDKHDGFQTKGYTSDDDHLPIFLNMELEHTDRLSFEYINYQGTDLNFSIKMEVEHQDKKTHGLGRRKMPEVDGMKDKKKKPKKSKFPEGEPADFRSGF